MRCNQDDQYEPDCVCDDEATHYMVFRGERWKGMVPVVLCRAHAEEYHGDADCVVWAMSGQLPAELVVR